MERRLFFKNLLGGAAAVAIAPKLFDQITEQEYLPPLDGPPPSPEMVFDSGTGLWIFSNEKLIAYGGYQGVTLKFHREIIDVTMRFKEPEYLPGPMEGSWHVEDLVVNNPYQMLDLDTPVHIVCKTPEHGTIESDAICRSISTFSVTMTQSLFEADFDIVGETTIYA